MLRRWARILLAAGIVTGAIVLVTYEEQQTRVKYQRICYQSSAPVLVGDAENKPCNNKCEDAKEYMPWWYVLVAWPDGFTVWAILGTLAAIVWQSVETRRATESQRDKDRARLFVNISDRPEHADFNKAQSGLSDIYWSLGITVTQHGATKAFNVNGYAIILIKPSTEKHPTVSRKRMLPVIFIPKVIDQTPIPLEGFINFRGVEDDVLRDIDRGDSQAHFFGSVQYQDVFGVSRQTTFRYRWVPEERVQIPGAEEPQTMVIEESHWIVDGTDRDNRGS